MSDDSIPSEQSDENNDDFIAGLKEMGLLSPNAVLTPDAGKSRKSGASKNKGRKSKRRPPSKRPTINIDDLLDGIGNTNNSSPSSDQSNPFNLNDVLPSKKGSLKNSGKSESSSMQLKENDPAESFMSRLELNIESYLTSKFLNLREDFVSDLQHLLAETDCIEVEVNKFLNDLKNGLREIISFDFQTGNQVDRVVAVLDSLCPAFLSVMKTIPKNDSVANAQAEIESANLAQAAVTSFSPLLKDNFKSSSDELARDLAELHELQSQVKKNEIKNMRQRKTLTETLLDYESQKITQQIESQSINDMSHRIADLRKSLIDEDEDDEDDDHTDIISKKLKNALTRLRKTAESTYMEPVARIRKFHRKLNDYREESAQLRNMIMYNNQMLVSRSFQAMSTMLSSQDSIYQQSFQQTQTIPRSPETPPRVSFAVNDDGNNSSSLNRSFELIDDVRSRLKQIQDQHDADLQNISSFLQDLKRSEKQRVRAEIMTE